MSPVKHTAVNPPEVSVPNLHSKRVDTGGGRRYRQMRKSSLSGQVEATKGGTAGKNLAPKGAFFYCKLWKRYFWMMVMELAMAKSSYLSLAYNS